MCQARLQRQTRLRSCVRSAGSFLSVPGLRCPAKRRQLQASSLFGTPTVSLKFLPSRLTTTLLMARQGANPDSQDAAAAVSPCTSPYAQQLAGLQATVGGQED